MYFTHQIIIKWVIIDEALRQTLDLFLDRDGYDDLLV